MARIEEGFVIYLNGHAGLSALISTRLFPLILPEGVTMPAATYQRISGPRMRSHSGPSGVSMPRYQFNCWGDTYKQAKEVADQVRIALESFSGTMGTVPVHAGFVEDDRDFYDEDVKQFFTAVDVILRHEEAIA